MIFEETSYGSYRPAPDLMDDLKTKLQSVDAIKTLVRNGVISPERGFELLDKV